MIETLDHLIIAVKDLDEAEKNYTKIFGEPPVWRGEHKELGTSNSLFNFNNTYFELLAATGDGLGAALVNYYLEESGEGLIGVVFGTNNIHNASSLIQEKGFTVNEYTDENYPNRVSDIANFMNIDPFLIEIIINYKMQQV